MIASVTIAPRTSLAVCRGGLQGSPKLLSAARSLVSCRNCRRSQRAALPRDLTLRWIPRRRWPEPHRRTPSRTAGSGKTAARVTARVAISVAVQRRATRSSQDRPRMLVQPEPIRTVATRAANFYFARCRLTSRLPAEIVEGRRRASPGVGLRWLFVWLLSHPSGLGGESCGADGARSREIAAGGADRCCCEPRPRNCRSKYQFWPFDSCHILYWGLLARASRHH